MHKYSYFVNVQRDLCNGNGFVKYTFTIVGARDVMNAIDMMEAYCDMKDWALTDDAYEVTPLDSENWGKTMATMNPEHHYIVEFK